MTITKALKVYTFSGITDRQGQFNLLIEDSVGNPLLLSAGDKVTATGAVAETLPALTSVINRPADTISGKAPVNHYFSVGFKALASSSYHKIWLKTNAEGIYMADFSALVGIPDSGTLISDVMFTRKASGNTTILEKISP